MPSRLPGERVQSKAPRARGFLQRKCACGQHAGGGECEECKKKRLQRRRDHGAEPSEVPPIVHEVVRSPAQPLDARTRDFSINAIAMDLIDGTMHDPTGGEADLRNRIVRVLHEQSFIDDPTRIFRAASVTGFDWIPIRVVEDQ